MPASDHGPLLRFRDCELDLAAYTLRRNGRPIRLERQPMDLLIYLVERRDRLVTRAEIADRLWGKDVFVDVDTGVHTAIRKIRQALRDPTDAPAFLETVSGKGYRFVAPVEVVTAAAPPPPAPVRPLAPFTLAVLPFANLSGDPDRGYLAEGLAEDTAVSLGQVAPDRLRVLARSATLAYKAPRRRAVSSAASSESTICSKPRCGPKPRSSASRRASFV